MFSVTPARAGVRSVEVGIKPAARVGGEGQGDPTRRAAGNGRQVAVIDKYANGGEDPPPPCYLSYADALSPDSLAPRPSASDRVC